MYQTHCILNVKLSNAKLHGYCKWLIWATDYRWDWYSQFQSAVHSKFEDFDLWTEKSSPISKQG
jgi:hypothetical protein